MPAMATPKPFPWRAFWVTAILSVPSFAIAAASTLFALQHRGGDWDDVRLTISGHLIGGTTDIAVAAGVAVLFGAAGLFSILRFWTRLRLANGR